MPLTLATNPAVAGATPAAGDIRGLKPPVDIGHPWTWLLAAAVAAIAALLALWLWRRWRMRRAQAVAAREQLPPHVRARRRLGQALALIHQPEPFCVEVSAAIRQYLEEQFDFRAPERTTEEFLHELQRTNLLSPDQKDSLGGFLSRCDLVKFARYEPAEAELRQLHAAALRLMDETEPAAATPDQEPAAAR
jgi:C4-dicarboxylate-specific signal transduction histidine kinase